MTRGIVLFAHGSRDPLWHRPMQAVAAQLLQTHADVAVECAYLELSIPDLATVCASLVESGIVTITIVPMFLGVGKHAREDLPLLVAALSVRRIPEQRLRPRALKPRIKHNEALL